MKDDIEILDIFNEKKEPMKEKVEEMVPKKISDNKKKPKKKMKTKAWQILFCSVSFIFILGCIIYYGSRLIKYYRIYNPKVDTTSGEVLLARNIIGNSEMVYEGAGLYSSSGNYLYKGDVKNNYIKYNNMLWRIVKINMDNTIDIILDDYISILPWNNEVSKFAESKMYNYLNNDFLNNLNKDMLVKSNFCEDRIDDLSSITCNSQNSDSYVKLMDVTAFLNSVKDKKTYLAKDNEIFWLSDYSEDDAWHTNGSNVSKSAPNIFYEIRPMVKLKNTVTFTEGEGTIDKPYMVGKNNELELGSIVKLGDDEWLVYEITDSVKLMRKNVLSEQMIFDKNELTYNVDKEDSLAKYLNTTYLDSLSYKNMIINSDWYVGSYENSIEDIKKEKIVAKVGLPSLTSIKLDSSVNGYFTLTNNGETIYVYEEPLRPSRPSSKRNIRPCIAISKDDANKLKYSDGMFKEE